MKLQDFHNKHRGETIYILASGPELAFLPKEYLKYLSTQVTITMNHSFMAMPNNYSMYWITGHWSMIALMEQLGKAATDCFFVRRRVKNKEYGSYIMVPRMPYKPGVLPQKTDKLVSVKNVTFAAFHLAYIMGAKRIVIHGLELENGLHFWNFNSKIEEELRSAILSLINHPGVIAIGKTELINSYRTIFKKEALENKNYYSKDISFQYKNIIATLIKNGVDVCYTTDKGILTKTKARKIELIKT